MQHDLWYAMRRLRAQPWHTAIVVAIFAIGTGAALTVFRVADAVLLHALPYRDAERLVHVGMHVPIAPNQELPYSDVGYRAIEHRTRTIEATASYRTTGVNVTVRDAPLRLTSARVTGNFFSVLGLGAQLGRVFTNGEEATHGPAAIVLSDALWRRTFATSPTVVGTVVRVDGEPATIVGVADARVAFPTGGVDYWTLMELDPNGTAPFNLGLDVIARLRRGVSVDAATADASRIIREVFHENPPPHSSPGSDFADYRAIIRPIRDSMAGGVGPTLALLSAAVGFVLCLTCVNVATLELVRASGRRAELATRAALGADQGRLIAGAIIEGASTAIAGCAIGLALSAFTVGILSDLLPPGLRDQLHGRPSLGMLVAVLATILICTAASAVFPLAAVRSDIQSGLRDRAGSATRRIALVRRSLVVAQIAFACLLVDGAVLMIATVRRAQQVSLGFRTDGVVTFQLSLPRESYPRPSDVSSTFGSLVDQLRALPGVAAVGVASNVPLGKVYQETLIGVEGRPFKADGTDPGADVRIVSSGYFGALGVPVITGRAFRDGDGYLDGTPVVISQSLVKLLFPNGEDPIGHRLRTGPFAPWVPIIGVVRDTRNRSLTAASRPELYLPFGAPRSPMGVSRDMSFVIRSAGATAAVQSAAQRVVLRANPDLPLYGLRRLDDVVAESQTREVTTMRTLTGFAVVALALAVAGSYAMLMFAVVQRRRELALRQAIGATSNSLVAMIGREMAQLLAVGLCLGLLGTVLLSQLLSRFLFGVTALDAGATLTTVAIVAIAGLGAALIPARRASMIDPMLVLRSE